MPATPEPSSWETITILGASVGAIVYGIIGAFLGIANTPALTPRVATVALFGGLVCAMLVPSAAQWAARQWLQIELPPVATNVIAFVFGLGGMVIIPGLMKLWGEIAADPLGFWKKWRGGDK